MILEKNSFGIGDRFGREGKAQLAALMRARGIGIEVVPVWNKSHREHTIIGTVPSDTRDEADGAVRENGWKHSYYVDADHIGPTNVEIFLESSDFFTIDVADWIGIRPAPGEAEDFLRRMRSGPAAIPLPGVSTTITLTDASLSAFVARYSLAVRKAAEVYRSIADRKGGGNCIIEVSFDEAESDQSPEELFLILAALAQHGIPVQTIAPKFIGKFLKGVDYVGDVGAFARQFDVDLAVIRYAREHFDLPQTLKLSVHSGSDKFSVYPAICRGVQKHDTGLHVKTAGTTWLEELIGLAEAGGEGLAFAKTIYAESLDRYDDLIKPYLAVVDIALAHLPAADVVNRWTGEEFAEAVRHDRTSSRYNSDLRQLLHVGYKVAAERRPVFEGLLDANRAAVERNVTENLYRRHLLPLFQG